MLRGMTSPNSINARIEQLVCRLIAEGMLDDQFRQLMKLQNETNPDFLTEVVDLFFFESKRRMQRFSSMLLEDQPNFRLLDQHVLDFKGSAASFGAKTIANLCDALRAYCQQHSLEKCHETLRIQWEALTSLERSMETFMQLETERKDTIAAVAPAGADRSN